jgi:hypothetical protein
MDDRRKGSTAVARTRVGQQEELVDTIKAAVSKAVAEREERAAEEEEREKHKKRSLLPAFFVVVLIGFIASALYAFFEMRAMSTPLEEELGIETSAVGVHLYSIAVRLEQFNQENGHYPASLRLAGLPDDESLEYTLVSPDTYRMKYDHQGVMVNYRSTQPPTTLLSGGARLEN